MADFCRTEGLPYRESGKVVVAATEAQLPALEELAQRGEANGLQGIERLGRAGIRDHEPHASGVGGLFVPETGYVDFGAVAARFAHHLKSGGVPVATGSPVSSVEITGTGCVVHGADERIEARLLINCAGLHADTLARMTGHTPPVRIIPFRGEYFHLRRPELVASAIYPVPDPRFPFLGVHFTRRVDGTVEVGPNAVLAWGREHYRGARPRPREAWWTLRYPGFWRMAARYWRTGLTELAGSWSPARYARRARALVPGIRRQDLVRGGSGVRAQAVRPDGTLADDFVILENGPFLHVLNAPSPAATAALEIGDHLAGLAVDRLGG
jgi:L-2-hydroxyglutarate oxidase LhgO